MASYGPLTCIASLARKNMCYSNQRGGDWHPNVVCKDFVPNLFRDETKCSTPQRTMASSSSRNLDPVMGCSPRPESFPGAKNNTPKFLRERERPFGLPFWPLFRCKKEKWSCCFSVQFSGWATNGDRLKPGERKGGRLQILESEMILGSSKHDIHKTSLYTHILIDV